MLQALILIKIYQGVKKVYWLIRYIYIRSVTNIIRGAYIIVKVIPVYMQSVNNQASADDKDLQYQWMTTERLDRLLSSG